MWQGSEVDMAYVVMIGKRYFEAWESPAVWLETIDPDRARVFGHRDRAKHVADHVGGRVGRRL